MKNRRNNHTINWVNWLLPLCLFAFLPLNAQDSLLLRDYRFIQQSNPWLTQDNSAALVVFDTKNIAQADLSLTTSSGHLTTFGGSSSALQVTAAVESYYRISRRIVTYGSISYDNWSGRNMTGSVFLPLSSCHSSLSSANLRPFDIVEDSLTNPGRKHMDAYHLTGGLGYQLTERLALGVNLDYMAANYAKYKDLRHKNKLMELQLAVGAFSSLNSWLSAGANYIYHRQTESVSYNVYGKNDKTYKSLIDYGTFMGVVEQFGYDGYTDKSNEMPLFEDSHGGSLQFELRPFAARRSPLTIGFLSLFANLSYTHGTGYYGRKSPYTITYTNHDRDVFRLHTRLSLVSQTSRHSLDLTYSNNKLQNRAETYRPLTNAMGASYYEYYDPVETADKRLRTFSLDYTLYLGILGEQPMWTLTAGYHWQRRNTTVYLYPYYRRQQLTNREFTASVLRNILLSRGKLTVSINGGIMNGSGDPYQQGTFVTPAVTGQQGGADTSAPATMEAFLWQDYHLWTSPQYTLGTCVQYAFRFPSTNLLTYVGAALQHRHATRLANEDYCGRQRTTATITLGCTF